MIRIAPEAKLCLCMDCLFDGLFMLLGAGQLPVPVGKKLEKNRLSVSLYVEGTEYFPPQIAE